MASRFGVKLEQTGPAKALDMEPREGEDGALSGVYGRGARKPAAVTPTPVGMELSRVSPAHAELHGQDCGPGPTWGTGREGASSHSSRRLGRPALS